MLRRQLTLKGYCWANPQWSRQLDIARMHYHFRIINEPFVFATLKHQQRRSIRINHPVYGHAIHGKRFTLQWNRWTSPKAKRQRP